MGLRGQVALCRSRQISSALTGDLAGLWRWRIGDYRVVARITILVVRVAHRREVYR